MTPSQKRVGIAILIAVLVACAIILSKRRVRERGSTSEAVAHRQTQAAILQPPKLSAPQQATAADTRLEDCMKEWRRHQSDTQRVEREHLLMLPLPKLFTRGTSNPAAQAALAPLVDADL